MGNPHIDDDGTLFEAELVSDGIPINLAGAEELHLDFQRPDGTTCTKTARLSTDGTDAKIYYRAEPGFLSQEGTWKWQGFAKLPSGQWHSDIYKFKVEANLINPETRP